MKLWKLLSVGALALAASALAMEGAIQSAQSQCCPGPPPREDRGGPNGNGGAPEEPAPELTWDHGEEIDLNEDDDEARRPDMKIDLLEDAKEGTKPVVLYVGTESDDRAFRRAREACEDLECCLFGNHSVATMMKEDFKLVRVNIEDLSSRTIREYNLRPRTAPQVLILDVELNRVGAYQGANVNVRDFERTLERAKKQTEQLLERRERRASR